MEEDDSNTRIQEYIFLEDILIDLKRNYNKHNSKVLEEILAIVQHRIYLYGKRK